MIGIGTNLGAMSFKFGLTEKNSQAIEQLAIGTLRVGVNKNNTDTMELVNNGKLSTSMLYTSIK